MSSSEEKQKVLDAFDAGLVSSSLSPEDRLFLKEFLMNNEKINENNVWESAAEDFYESYLKEGTFDPAISDVKKVGTELFRCFLLSAYDKANDFFKNKTGLFFGPAKDEALQVAEKTAKAAIMLVRKELDLCKKYLKAKQEKLPPDKQTNLDSANPEDGKKFQEIEQKIKNIRTLLDQKIIVSRADPQPYLRLMNQTRKELVSIKGTLSLPDKKLISHLDVALSILTLGVYAGVRALHSLATKGSAQFWKSYLDIQSDNLNEMGTHLKKGSPLKK